MPVTLIRWRSRFIYQGKKKNRMQLGKPTQSFITHPATTSHSSTSTRHGGNPTIPRTGATNNTFTFDICGWPRTFAHNSRILSIGILRTIGILTLITILSQAQGKMTKRKVDAPLRTGHRTVVAAITIPGTNVREMIQRHLHRPRHGRFWKRSVRGMGSTFRKNTSIDPCSTTTSPQPLPPPQEPQVHQVHY